MGLFSRSGRRTVSLLLSVSLLSIAVRANAEEESGAAALEKLFPKKNAPRKRQIAGFGDANVSYGYEGEYLPNRVPQLSDWYDAKGLRRPKAPSFLASKLAKEPLRHELLTRPTNTLESAFFQQDAIVEKTGLNEHGQSKLWWQGNVAFPRRPEFTKRHEQGIEGYVYFSADYAVFGKLHNAHLIAQKNEQYLPARNFLHNQLGPMNEHNQRDIKGELQASMRGEASGNERHYIQGTYFRTMGYSGDGVPRDGFELRDPHHDLVILEREMRRATAALKYGFDDYKAFAKVRQYKESYDGEFGTLPREVRGLLRNVRYRDVFGSMKVANPPRYAWPLRPIEEDYSTALKLDAKESATLRARVKKARATYIATLEAMAANKASLSSDQVLYGLHRALARFVYETGLYPMLDRHVVKTARRYLQLRRQRLRKGSRRRRLKARSSHLRRFRRGKR
jgi:hypothetical protein